MNRLQRFGAASGIALGVGAGFGLGAERAAEFVLNPAGHVREVNDFAALIGDPRNTSADLQAANPDLYSQFPTESKLQADGTRKEVTTTPNETDFLNAQKPAAIAEDLTSLRVDRIAGLLGGLSLTVMTFLVVEGKWVPRLKPATKPAPKGALKASEQPSFSGSVS